MERIPINLIILQENRVSLFKKWITFIVRKSVRNLKGGKVGESIFLFFMSKLIVHEKVNYARYLTA